MTSTVKTKTKRMKTHWCPHWCSWKQCIPYSPVFGKNVNVSSHRDWTVVDAVTNKQSTNMIRGWSDSGQENPEQLFRVMLLPNQKNGRTRRSSFWVDGSWTKSCSSESIRCIKPVVTGLNSVVVFIHKIQCPLASFFGIFFDVYDRLPVTHLYTHTQFSKQINCFLSVSLIEQTITLLRTIRLTI